MLHSLKHTALCLTLCAAGLAPSAANAAITVTDLQITANSISLTLNGVFEGQVPVQYQDSLSLVNADHSGGRVFGIAPMAQASSVSSDPSSTFYSSFIGFDASADYIVMRFSTFFMPGSSVNNLILTATWDSPYFNTEYITSATRFNLYWGGGMIADPTAGVFLAEASAIPEPSTVALLSAGAAALVAVAVRRRRNKA